MPPLRSYKDPFTDLPPPNLASHNPYLNKVRDAATETHCPNVLYGPYLKEKKGKWLSWFRYTRKNNTAQPQRLIVEIGSHDGSVLCSLAAQHPQDYFVGIDITLKRIYKASRLAKSHNTTNVAFAYVNARCMEHLFANAEIHGLVIFFPDPWQKKARQQKHRLLNQEFIQGLYKRLKPNATIWFKTDHKPYFLTSHQLFCSAGFRCEHSSQTDMASFVSTFEKHFLANQQPILSQCYKKSAKIQKCLQS